jgi:antitoxin VapB
MYDGNEVDMRSGGQKAKLFKNGGSQAVRLPKDCRFSGSEVWIRREGSRVILEPLATTWSPKFRAAFLGEPDESFPDRQQPIRAPDREPLDE